MSKIKIETNVGVAVSLPFLVELYHGNLPIEIEASLDRFVTGPQAQEMLGMNHASLRYHVRQGHLRAFPVSPRDVYYLKSEVAQLAKR